MPAQWVSEQFTAVVEKAPGIGQAALVAKLAKLFGVSAQAMGFRLINLGSPTSVGDE